jgi:large subunit ribosomal protein L18e
MVKRTGPTNIHLRRLIRALEKASRENNARIWKYVAELLSKPRRDRVEVNIGKIDRLSNENDVIVVPGKVLGSGKLTKKVKIAAWRFSESSLAKIKEAGAEAIKIEDLVKENPKGTNVKIII